MPYPFHANVDFSEFSDSEIDDKASLIITSLTTNAADFPDLPFDVPSLIPLRNNYRDISAMPIYPSKTADQAAARKDLESALHDDGVYVNTVAKGNLSLLEKSGYPISKAHLPVGPLPKTTINATPIVGGESGGFDVEISSTPHAHGFLVLCIPVAPTIAEIPFSQWPWHYFAKHKGQITGLGHNTRYRLVSVALGTDPTLTFSDAIERVTQ